MPNNGRRCADKIIMTTSLAGGLLCVYKPLFPAFASPPLHESENCFPNIFRLSVAAMGK